ncbi:hypothetical protein BGZ83_000460 [Gryganskiella cystojenkinii]|nr:hypothetical protein BGZ83_000460 [Gryganskiella cystojenkinii]
MVHVSVCKDANKEGSARAPYEAIVSLLDSSSKAIIVEYKLRYHKMTKDDDIPSLHLEKSYSIDDLKQLLKIEYTRDFKHVNGGNPGGHQRP